MIVIVVNLFVEQVYYWIKDDIFSFCLLLGDNFIEIEMVQCQGVLCIFLWDVLFRLQCEGYLEVGFWCGWKVCLIDFDCFDNFYDLCIVLEMVVLEKFCSQQELMVELEQLNVIWLVEFEVCYIDVVKVVELDEVFYINLVVVVGNVEMIWVYIEVMEKICIVCCLDFFKKKCIEVIYEEYGKIL